MNSIWGFLLSFFVCFGFSLFWIMLGGENNTRLLCRYSRMYSSFQLRYLTFSFLVLEYKNGKHECPRKSSKHITRNICWANLDMNFGVFWVVRNAYAEWLIYKLCPSCYAWATFDIKEHAFLLFLKFSIYSPFVWDNILIFLWRTFPAPLLVHARVPQCSSRRLRLI